ncbi:MAG: 6-bladed beta-propeller [Bacteroidota bacterium]
MSRRNITLPVLIGLLVLIAAGCSKNLSRSTAHRSAIIYPTPPDTARVQFLTAFSSSENTIGKQTAFSRFIFGESPVRPIKKPYGIAIHSGKIYICDSGLGLLEVIDLRKNTFEYFDPQGEGKLKLPLNCFVDKDGKLYIADGLRMQVVIFDADGKYLSAFGEAEKYKPTDVFVTDDKIWVANIKNNKIHVYSKATNQLLYTFPQSEQGQPDFLYSPANLYVTSDKVYVSDIGDFKIKIYDHNGKFISAVGSNGTNAGQFVRPKGIAVDKEENLFVVDAGFENTQIFNKDGKILMFFGGPYKGPGDMWLPAKVIIDYDNLELFEKYVDPAYKLNYLVFVSNQFGPDKINVYASIRQKEKPLK